MTTTTKYILGSAILLGTVIIFRKQIAGFFNSMTGSTERSLVKCCTARDSNCQCTSSEFKKQEECSAVPCPPYTGTRVIITSPLMEIANGGGNGGGRPIPAGLVS